jgi:hypothetical protein
MTEVTVRPTLVRLIGAPDRITLEGADSGRIR